MGAGRSWRLQYAHDLPSVVVLQSPHVPKSTSGAGLAGPMQKPARTKARSFRKVKPREISVHLNAMSARLSMAKILVIDDGESVRKMLQAVLKSAGHEVSTAADGRQGMQAVARQSVDLVIVDIIMPEQDGLETITQLRRGYPNIKIIAISASSPATRDAIRK